MQANGEFYVPTAFNSGEMATGPHRIGNWIGSKASPDKVVAKGKFISESRI